MSDRYSTMSLESRRASDASFTSNRLSDVGAGRRTSSCSTIDPQRASFTIDAQRASARSVVDDHRASSCSTIPSGRGMSNASALDSDGMNGSRRGSYEDVLAQKGSRERRYHMNEAARRLSMEPGGLARIGASFGDESAPSTPRPRERDNPGCSSDDRNDGSPQPSRDGVFNCEERSCR